jgi:hypothetical protein
MASGMKGRAYTPKYAANGKYTFRSRRSAASIITLAQACREQSGRCETDRANVAKAEVGGWDRGRDRFGIRLLCDGRRAFGSERMSTQAALQTPQAHSMSEAMTALHDLPNANTYVDARWAHNSDVNRFL